MFGLPQTPSCRVSYVKGGVLYSTVLTTPANNDALQMAMLNKGVGMSQVKGVEGIAPRGDLKRPHPAQYRISRLMAASEQ